MDINKITAVTLAGKGVVGLPDTPGFSTADMQRKLDEIALDVLVPGHNELVDALDDVYTKDETDGRISQRIIDIGSADMTRAVYDVDDAGVVDNAQRLGGQLPGYYAQANSAFSTYTHTLSNGVHELTGSGDNIRFVAAANYGGGEAFTINGVPVSAATAAGEEPEDSLFVEGAVVTCYKNGDAINFNSGGTQRNYKIVGGSARPTTGLCENLIWVSTTVPITSYLFSAGIPTGLDGHPPGRLWITTGVASKAAFNTLKSPIYPGYEIETRRMLAYPLTGYMFDGSKWTQCPVEIYQNGVWISTYYYLWNAGNTGHSVTGAVSGANSTRGDFWCQTYNSNGGWATSYTAINLTGFNTLIMAGNFLSTANAIYGFGAYSSAAGGSSAMVPIVGQSGSNLGSSTNVTFSFDVSSLEGTYYIGAKTYSGSTVSASASANFSQIYLY